MATAEQRGVEAHAQELYELQRPSGHAFWHELPEAERAGWIAAARAESRPRVDELNEAAGVVYEVAFARGKREGAERERDLVSHEHAVSMLELAGGLARYAVGSEEDEVALTFARFARMALGRTPYERCVRRAIAVADCATTGREIHRDRLRDLPDAVALAGQEMEASLRELRAA